MTRFHSLLATALAVSLFDDAMAFSTLSIVPRNIFTASSPASRRESSNMFMSTTKSGITCSYAAPKNLSNTLVIPTLALATAVLMLGGGDAAVAEGRSGQEIFSAKCAACHAGGGNTLNPGKTLSKADLEKNGYGTVDQIVEIVSKGKRPMPAYAIKSKALGLSPDEINGVSEYVLQRATEGWVK